MKPSAEQIKQEALDIDALRDEADDPSEDVFLAGVLRGLEWTQGIGMSPTDWLRTIRRVNKVH